MKSIIFVVCLFISTNIFAQNINEINSNNVLSYITSSAIVTNNQMGNNNSIELLLTNQVKNISINQFGENNNLNYFDYINRNIVIDNEFVMRGSNNSIAIFGSNSISQNMTIDVSANNKTITIINR